MYDRHIRNQHKIPHPITPTIAVSTWGELKSRNRARREDLPLAYTPPEERVCTHCRNKIEEFHMIVECALFSDIRSRLIPRKFWQRPSMHKLINLLNSKNKSILKGLAKFIYLAFEMKAQLLL